MALPHALPFQPIDLAGPGDAPSRSLLKTDRLQLLRLVLGPEQPQPEHRVDAECVIHCLQGAAEVIAVSGRQRLGAGQLLVMPAGERHSIAAAESAVVLVTLLLTDGNAGDGGGRGSFALGDADAPTDTTTPSRFQA